MEERRKALEELDKAALVAIVLRLQDQLKAERETRSLAFEDGRCFAKAQQEAAELASRAETTVFKEVGR